MDEKNVVCRLCLNLITYDESQTLDPVSENILKSIVPHINLKISQDPKICQTCYKTMLQCYKFKTSYVGHETKTEIKTNSESTNAGQSHKTCAVCVNNVDRESLDECTSCGTEIKEMLQNSISNWCGVPDPVLCSVCLKSLRCFHNFIRDCRKIENKISSFSALVGTDMEKVNLLEVVQYNLNRSSDSTTDCMTPIVSVYIKPEKLTSEEVDIKMESNEWESPEQPMEQHNANVTGSSRSTSRESPRMKIIKKKLQDADSNTSRKKMKPVEKRDVGVQVNIKDLVQTCSVGVQVEDEFFSFKSVAVDAICTEKESMVSSTSGTKVVTLKQKKFQPRILKRTNKKAAKSGRDGGTATATGSKEGRGKTAEYYREYRARKRREQERESSNTMTDDPFTVTESSATIHTPTNNVAGSKPLRKRKTNAEYQREYRARQKARRDSLLDDSTNLKKRKTAAEYQRDYRIREKAKRESARRAAPSATTNESSTENVDGNIINTFTKY